MIAPLAGHAVDDVAMAIHQDRRRLRILAIVGEKIWRPAAWGFDQPAFEIEPRERRLQLFLEIGAQTIALLGVLAFRPVSYAAAEFGEEFAGLKLLAGARDGVGSAHLFCQLTNASKLGQPS